MELKTDWMFVCFLFCLTAKAAEFIKYHRNRGSPIIKDL